MEPKLRIRSSGHGGSGYRHPHTGDIVPGVTTVLKKLEKPAIVQWAVDNTAAYAVANIDALLSRTEEQGYGFLRWYWKRDPLAGDAGDIRNYSNGVLNDAAELGTFMHDWIAADHGACAYPDVSNAPDYFWEMVNEWDNWKHDHDVIPIHSEVTFWSKKHGYAGTADAVWLVDGIPMLIDIKTSRNTWDEHWMQLAALSNCETMLLEPTDGHWIEEKIPTFESYALLHLRPSDMDKNGNPMEPFCELKQMNKEEIPVLLDAFLGLLQVSHAQNKLKEIRANAMLGSVSGNKEEN